MNDLTDEEVLQSLYLSTDETGVTSLGMFSNTLAEEFMAGYFDPDFGDEPY